MRGGAQAHLLEADDGKWYVVKFRNNPQHRRVLVNEALCATLLRYLRIAAPQTALCRRPRYPGISPFLARAHRSDRLATGSGPVDVGPVCGK